MQHPLCHHIQPHARRGSAAQQPGMYNMKLDGYYLYFAQKLAIIRLKNTSILYLFPVLRRPGRHPRRRPPDPPALHVQGGGLPPPGQDQLRPQDG